MLHDFGKFSKEFQNYIGSATGKINLDEDEFVDFKGMKGKVDHSSAGAQWVWDYCMSRGEAGQLVGQIFSLCIASHHSGLIDCLRLEGSDSFLKRMEKEDIKTHKNECIENAPADYLEKIETLLNTKLLKSVAIEINKLASLSGAGGFKQIWSFYQGLWTRMLFSCLIDADRIDSADFEYPENSRFRCISTDWSVVVNRLELAIREFQGDKPVDQLRRDISDTCKTRAEDKQGVYIP